MLGHGGSSAGSYLPDPTSTDVCTCISTMHDVIRHKLPALGLLASHDFIQIGLDVIEMWID